MFKSTRSNATTMNSVVTTRYPILVSTLSTTQGVQYQRVGKHLGKFHLVYGDIHGYLSAFVCTFGLIANMLNIAVLSKKQMVNPTNIILIALAIADVLVMASYLVFAFYMYIPTMKEPVHLYGWAVFVLFHFNLTMTAHTISSWVTVFLAAFRCLSIFKPIIRKRLFDNKTTIICLVILYLLVIFSCLPYYMSYTIVPIKETESLNSSLFTKSPLTDEAITNFLQSTLAQSSNAVRDGLGFLQRFDRNERFNNPLSNLIHHPKSLLLIKIDGNHQIPLLTSLRTWFKSLYQVREKRDILRKFNTTFTLPDEKFGNTLKKKSPQKYITTQNSKHSNLVLMNFIMYSVIGKLLPCLLLTIMSALLIWVVYNANSKHKKLKGSNPLKISNPTRQSHVAIDMPSHIGQNIPLNDQPSTMKNYKGENFTETNSYLYKAYKTKPSLNSLKFETSDEVTALVNDKISHANKLTIMSLNATCQKSEKSSLLNSAKKDSLPFNYMKPSIALNKKVGGNDLIQTIRDDVFAQGLPDDNDDIFQDSNKPTRANSHFNTYNYIRNKMKSGMGIIPLHKHSIKRKESVGRSRGDKTSQLLLAVLLFFLLTEFPSGILSLLCIENILGTPFFIDVYSPLGDLMDMMALINSSINFIVYCTMSQQFREAFTEMMTNTYRSTMNYLTAVKNYVLGLICTSYTTQQNKCQRTNGLIEVNKE